MNKILHKDLEARAITLLHNMGFSVALEKPIHYVDRIKFLVLKMPKPPASLKLCNTTRVLAPGTVQSKSNVALWVDDLALRAEEDSARFPQIKVERIIEPADNPYWRVTLFLASSTAPKSKRTPFFQKFDYDSTGRRIVHYLYETFIGYGTIVGIHDKKQNQVFIVLDKGTAVPGATNGIRQVSAGSIDYINNGD